MQNEYHNVKASATQLARLSRLVTKAKRNQVNIRGGTARGRNIADGLVYNHGGTRELSMSAADAAIDVLEDSCRCI